MKESTVFCQAIHFWKIKGQQKREKQPLYMSFSYTSKLKYVLRDWRRIFCGSKPTNSFVRTHWRPREPASTWALDSHVIRSCSSKPRQICVPMAWSKQCFRVFFVWVGGITKLNDWPLSGKQNCFFAVIVCQLFQLHDYHLWKPLENARRRLFGDFAVYLSRTIS